MENIDLNCEVIFTNDLFFRVNKYIFSKKRKGLLIYFILITLLIILLLLLDIFGPDNIHPLYAGSFFAGYSILALVVLFQTRNSLIKQKIIKNRESLTIRSFYSFNEESMIVESESTYSKTKIQYQYKAITNIEKVEEKIIIINFNDTRTAIIQSNKSEEIYNYINYKIKGGI